MRIQRQQVYPIRTNDLHDRLLLILDLDETLIHSSGRPLERPHDFVVGPYFVHVRPGTTRFLSECDAFCNLAVWSSGGDEYVTEIVRRILPETIQPAFVWSRERCVRCFDHERGEEYFAKDLKKIKRRGFRLERTFILEDEPHKVTRNYGNAVFVTPWFGEPHDAELPKLAVYLQTLATVPDVRRLEKRDWRRRVQI